MQPCGIVMRFVERLSVPCAKPEIHPSFGLADSLSVNPGYPFVVPSRLRLYVSKAYQTR